MPDAIGVGRRLHEAHAGQRPLLTLYLDTSLLVAAFTKEAATNRAFAFLSKPGEQLAISEWVNAEFSAALSIKMRMGAIDEAYRNKAAMQFSTAVADSMQVIVVATPHFRAAAQYAARHKLGLRAADALHLAIAGDAAATLCTLDKRLASAGKALGVATKLV